MSEYCASPRIVHPDMFTALPAPPLSPLRKRRAIFRQNLSVFEPDEAEAKCKEAMDRIEIAGQSAKIYSYPTYLHLRSGDATCACVLCMCACCYEIVRIVVVMIW